MLIVNFFLELWTGYIIVQVWTRYTGRIYGGRQETSDTRFYLGILLFRSGPGILAGFLEADRRHRMQDIYLGILLFIGLGQVYWQDFWRQTGDIWYRIFTWVYYCSGLDQVDRRHLIQFIYLCILLLRSGPGILAGFLEADRRHLMQDIYLNISFRNSRCDNIYSPIVSLNFIVKIQNQILLWIKRYDILLVLSIIKPFVKWSTTSLKNINKGRCTFF